MPDDLRAQFPIVREIAGMMNMPIRELEGYEADDVIGTLTKKATAAGVDTMIVSGDLDGLQLVDDHVRLLTTRMGVAATVIYDEARVIERYGLRPDQMLDYKALKGDTSDNIPGVPGVGEKTAVEPAPAVRHAGRDLRAPRRGQGQAPRPAGRAPRVGIHVARGRPDRDRPAGRAGHRRGADRPIRPPSGRPAVPRARVPLAHRPAAGLEHRPDRLRRPGAGDEGRAPAQPRAARWRRSRRRRADGEPRGAARPARGPGRRDRARRSEGRAQRGRDAGAGSLARRERRRGRARLGGRQRAPAGAAPVRDRGRRARRQQLVRAVRPVEHRGRAAADLVRAGRPPPHRP